MLIRQAIVVALLALAVLAGRAGPVRAAGLPQGFVYLRDVDASIVQDMRYAGAHNFVGRPLAGYEAPECILALPAARALKAVQNNLKAMNLSLKVYDCYRPARAVADLVAWLADPADQAARAEFYPSLDKKEIAALGYIVMPSAHSRGAAVDVAIVRLPARKQPDWRPGDPLRACHLPKVQRYADNSLDFGTGFDCFHPLSRTANPAITGEARHNRDLLVRQMARAGFANAAGQWWHFTLKREPFAATAFDFPVAPAPPGPVRGAKESRELRLAAACLFKGESLQVRDGPGRGYRVIARLAPDATGLKPLRCEGNVSLVEWFGLDAIARQTVFAPWCLIEVPAARPGTPALQGWVDAAFLADAAAPASPPCRAR